MQDVTPGGSFLFANFRGSRIFHAVDGTTRGSKTKNQIACHGVPKTEWQLPGLLNLNPPPATEASPL
jgi:hypothetical protein